MMMYLYMMVHCAVIIIFQWLVKLNTDMQNPKIYRVDGEIHREDGPAVEFADGSKFWLRHGKPHREDGPILESAYGYKLWGLNGVLYPDEASWLVALIRSFE